MREILAQTIKSIAMMMLFFTRIPIKRQFDFDEQDYQLGIVFFPLIGLLIGLGLLIIKYVTFFVSPYISAIVLVFFYVWITGGIHIDGLSDTSDGIFSGGDKAKILDIMKDSRVGSFGSLAISLVIVSYVMLFADNAGGTILIMAIMGKVSILASASISEYAKDDDGLGTVFIKNCTERERNIGFAFITILALVVNYKLIVPVVATLILTGLITRYIIKKIGGMTGDTLGFVHEISQIMFLLISSLVL
ncbi:MAG: adenosylcobinamide-GDP ribazoletransferase [Eubacteriales bacterium]|nr:adenosylcobinamide-GDP ribazoletransferase [Eubacteriales bacterium]